jgi:hypothetical protein
MLCMEIVAVGKVGTSSPDDNWRKLWRRVLASDLVREGGIVRTYYFDIQDGVPVRDITGMLFSTDIEAIEHSKQLARRFSHDPRFKDPDHSIVVLSESGTEIHRELLTSTLQT